MNGHVLSVFLQPFAYKHAVFRSYKNGSCYSTPSPDRLRYSIKNDSLNTGRRSGATDRDTKDKE